MADEIISVNTTTSVDLDGDDAYLLLPGITHYVAGGVTNTVETTSGASGNQLAVYGVLTSISNRTISLDQSSATDVFLLIGSTGSVSNLSNSGFTIKLDGTDNIITNHGEISGFGAIDFDGSGHTLTNTGTITGSNDGGLATIGGANVANLTIVNSGTIAGYQTLEGHRGFVLNNSGQILSTEITISIPGFGLDSTSIYNSGTIASSSGVALSSNSYGVNVTNVGLITGDLILANQQDSVINSGVIDGDVSLGDFTDTYIGRGDGLVTGTVLGGTGDDTLRGSDRADSFDGGIGDDVIVGGGGDDTLNAGDNNDIVSGGGGDDTISGGVGNDTLNGNSGNDSISGEAGIDNLIGGTGDDTLRGGGDNDTLRAGSGTDSLTGDAGSDFLFGGADDDELSGGDDNDFLRGEAGNDLLEGDGGTDDLRGGTGQDTLDGGAGLDRLYGGAGADTFVYTEATDSQTGTIDTIFDFTQGEDVLDFSSFVGDFAYTGTGAHTGGGTASIRYIDTAIGVSVRADVDGDGSSDIIITVRDLDSMTEADFLL